MIQLSDTLIRVLANPVIETVYFVRIGTVFYMNTSATEYMLSNGVTYPANSRLLNIDPARMSSTVDRELYSIIIADPDFSFRESVENGIVGLYTEIRACFIDQDTGALITDINDSIVVYGGTVGTTNYNIDTANLGSAQATVQLTSPMASLDMTKVFYSSRDFMRDRNANDSSFDQVYLGSGAVVSKWGKA